MHALVVDCMHLNTSSNNIHPYAIQGIGTVAVHRGAASRKHDGLVRALRALPFFMFEFKHSLWMGTLLG